MSGTPARNPPRDPQGRRISISRHISAVGALRTYVPRQIGAVGALRSYVSRHISAVGALRTYVSRAIGTVGAHRSYVSRHIGAVGAPPELISSTIWLCGTCAGSVFKLFPRPFRRFCAARGVTGACAPNGGFRVMLLSGSTGKGIAVLGAISAGCCPEHPATLGREDGPRFALS